LRIVGGAYKGRKIGVSREFDSRPTTDFAREALFNILANIVDFEMISVLDLFSGTGSISFEFASRGCQDIDLVDNNGRSVHFIGRVANDFGMKGIHPVRMDVFNFIRICRKQYHVVFADPPFEMKNLAEVPGFVMQHNILLPEGIFVLEHPGSIGFHQVPGFMRERKYGNVHFSFFAPVHAREDNLTGETHNQY